MNVIRKWGMIVSARIIPLFTQEKIDTYTIFYRKLKPKERKFAMQFGDLGYIFIIISFLSIKQKYRKIINRTRQTVKYEPVHGKIKLSPFVAEKILNIGDMYTLNKIGSNVLL